MYYNASALEFTVELNTIQLTTKMSWNCKRFSSENIKQDSRYEKKLSFLIFFVTKAYEVRLKLTQQHLKVHL